MNKEVAIGTAAKRAGLSVKAVRFYEESGYIPHAARSDAGYRLYADEDVRRLRFLNRMRQLGVPLARIKPLLATAFTADCNQFMGELGEAFQAQKAAISRKIEELEALRDELDELAKHVAHCQCEPGQAVKDCGYCPIMDEEGGVANDFCC